MASSTYRVYLGLFVILSCIIFKAASDVQEINKVKENTDASSDLANITGQPFENFENGDKKCTAYDSCEECSKFNCTWISCLSQLSCAEEPAEECGEVACSNSTTTEVPTTPTTVNPNDTTTTEMPTTIPDNTTTTSTTTPGPNTTTESTTTTSTSPTPIPTNTTTAIPTSSSTTEAPAPPAPHPHTRHFDAGSFIGGIILTITVTAVAFAAWKFYRRRALSTSYTNF